MPLFLRTTVDELGNEQASNSIYSHAKLDDDQISKSETQPTVPSYQPCEYASEKTRRS